MRYSFFFNKTRKVIKNPRLLLKMPQYIQGTLYLHTVERLFREYFINGSKKDAILLTSSPKSGNTFFRFVWLNIIFLNELNGKNVNFVTLDEYMPDEGYFDDLKKDWEYWTLPCLLKTHRTFSEIHHPFRIIHVFRNPLDTMISFYHYLSNRVSGPKMVLSFLEKRMFNKKNLKFAGDFTQFLMKEEYLDFYCQHFVSWMNRDKSFPISYEVLLSKDCFEYLKNLIVHLQLFVEDEILKEAIRRSQPEILKNAPKSDKMAQSDMKFIRNAKTQQYKDKKYYGERELEIVRNKLKQYHLHSLNCFPEKYRPLLEKHPWEI